ncbi:MAG: hypothetical protein COA78_04770 [Blastopirellula sp.]|nr:MAG: hypothetical protein COA78_04770 [Blastopirellula sp.]
MNRRILIVCAILLSVFSTIPLAAKAAEDTGPPALLKMGSETTKADLVFELQITLNKYFKSPDNIKNNISLNGRWIVFKLPDDVTGTIVNQKEGETKSPILLSKNTELLYSVDDEWKTFNQLDDKAEITKIKLLGDFLKVDGIYGKKTFTAVHLFQLNQGLEPTGEVDAVTLRRLEPLYPKNSFLGSIMNWVRDLKIFTINDPSMIKHVTAIVMSVLILIASMIVFQFARSLSNSTKFLTKWLFTPSSSPWFTALRQKHVFNRVAHFAPALFIFFAAHVFPEHIEGKTNIFPYLDIFEQWNIIVCRLGLSYISFTFIWVALAFVDACDVIYTEGQPEENPINGIIRAAKRFVTVVGFILICGSLAGENPMYYVGGLGAFMAVIMLAFRDTILGLVASVQIITNKMVKIGDWIEMPKYGADGDVIEISLTRVKVQNFDKTFTTLPTYALLSESFRNWTGMQESGGRRIKRSIFIDLNTIKPLNSEMCDHFESMTLLTDYIQGKREDLREHLLKHDVIISPVNGRWLTNVGTYRIYLEKYLKQHPLISDELTVLVRQLKPTREGLPIEIYAFTNETDWGAYEQIQADIFDHVLSVLPEFELRVFQDPSEYNYPPADNAKHRINHDVTLNVASELNDLAKRDLQREVDRQNQILVDNPRKQVGTAVRKVEQEARRLDLNQSVTVSATDRKVIIVDRS